MSIYELRRDYSGAPLGRRDVDPNPFRQFERWYEQAVEADVTDPNAMTLATATKHGRPSVRVVLVKGVDEERGFVFYTDYTSRKGRELAENPQAALGFYWAELSRQVRIDGRAEKLPREESEAYFRSRPREAQLAAWASRQSHPVGSRTALEARVAELDEEYADVDVPLPPRWGGFVVVPDNFEFWQGRPGRLHDRITYERTADGDWTIERLSP